MDIVLGVSLEQSEVRLVLVEGENADGVTVDQDAFPVGDPDGRDGRDSRNRPDGRDDGGDGPAVTPADATDQIAAAILGTRESAVESGYHLTSTGVTVSDQAQATVLRDALARRKVENVMLVSAFLAAAALTQAVGAATGYTRTGLLFVEQDTAAYVVVDSADGSITRVWRRPLTGGGDNAVAELAALIDAADAVGPGPDGLFLVGAGVDVSALKPALEAATSLPVSVPERPDLALARGAALASAHAPLFAASTRALAWAQDQGGGEPDHDAPVEVPATPVDYDATEWQGVLAYSALPGGADDAADNAAYGAFLASLTATDEASHRDRERFLVAGSALASLFVLGVVALMAAIVIAVRPAADVQPEPGRTIIVPTRQATVPPPAVTAPAPPPPSVVPPSVLPPVRTVPKRVPAIRQPRAAVPAPPPKAPVEPAPPVPAAPPAVAPVVPVPVPVAPPAVAPAPPAVAPQPLFPGPQQAPPQRWLPGDGQMRGGFHPFHPFHPFRPLPPRHRGLFGR